MSDDDRPATDAELATQRLHSVRFRKVSNRYPRRVAEAYGGDLARAAYDSDETVTATVATYEREHGIAVRDWPAIGRAERDDDAGLDLDLDDE